ncbi:phage integrase family protein [Caballeronia concitans]|uniref:Phage integrase family protein n=1 Tax=Caballeronia concitans TaxID=1777133 RepID=A0A658R529_9BURK|nr:phage integrase family protein [Caballeronia concitans]
MPCHPTLDAYLHAYLDETGLRDEPNSPRLCTIAGGIRQLSIKPLPRANALCDGAATGAGRRHWHPIVNHAFRSAGTTAYLKNALAR